MNNMAMSILDVVSGKNMLEHQNKCPKMHNGKYTNILLIFSPHRIDLPEYNFKKK